jgi:DNA-binding response OmpR family regulator
MMRMHIGDMEDKMDKSILIVDDDINICKLLKLYLSNENFNVFLCHDGSSALDILHKNKIDLVLLDIMLPVINGVEVCKLIRNDYTIPVIMITAKDLLEDKLKGFEAGADDYVIKPFEPKEVIARVKARFRQDTSKTTLIHDEAIQIYNLRIDLNSYEVSVDGKLIDLKPKEIQLLQFMSTNKNIVFSRDQLLEKVWNYNFSGDTRTVDAHIKRLREKLDGLSSKWEIKTIWGVGYKFEVK